MPQFRKDLDRLRGESGDIRSPDRILAHYELEKVLAGKLRNATKEERASLYGKLYSQLFTQIVDHPQNTRPKDDVSRRVSLQLALLAPYLKKPTVFVEIGCGDAALSISMAQSGYTAIGVDVTRELIPRETASDFRFVLTDGTKLDLPSSSADVVYSNQLMEHLHPEDAYQQLTEIRRILKPGGTYVCVTPSRLTGPHDVSMYFDAVATGFHIQEYDYGSLKHAFLSAGFARFYAVILVKGRQFRIPYFIIRPIEILLSSLPGSIRSIFRHSRAMQLFLGVVAIGIR
jgi:SAM-dependent methyltransferase